MALWQPVEASVDATPDEDLLEQVFGPVCGQEATRRLVYLNQAGAQRHPRQESHDHRPSGSPIPLPDGPSLIPMWRAPVAQS